jgi:hypothetical protein
MRRTTLGLTVLVLVLAVHSGATGQGNGDVATVTVLHALPEFVADVYVNGELTLDGFEPETATDPLPLPPGDYQIDIREVGAPPDSDPVLSSTATIEAGQNVSIIARLTTEGLPELVVFENDVSAAKAGKARLVVRHAAGAPSLAVQVDDKPRFGELESGGEAVGQFAAGAHSIEFMVAETSEPVLGPADLSLNEGTAQIVYAVGSLEEDSLDLMIQTIDDLASAPSGVLTGNGGLAENPGFPLWGFGLMVLLAVSGVWSALVLVRKGGAR